MGNILIITIISFGLFLIIGIAVLFIIKRKGNQALKDYKKRIQTIIENSQAGYFFIDTKGVIKEVNSMWLKMYGYKTFEDVINKQFTKVENNENTVWAKELINGVLKGDSQYIKGENIRHCNDDSIAFHTFINSPVFEAGKVVGIEGFIFDTTMQKKAEEQWIKAKKLEKDSGLIKAAFLHNISHEIRTPMNAIIGFSEYLNNPDIPSEKRLQYTIVISQSSKQLLSIINDIVNMATVESGQEKLEEETMNLNMSLKIIHEKIKMKAISKKIDIKLNTSLPDSEAWIISDELKLVQIINNLLSNALKFTEEGLIEFGYDLINDQMKFYVKDSGIGVPNSMRERVFEHFTQADSNLARKFGGTGLGLSISKAYVELFGGKIWLNSTPGKGAEFFFTIPYKKVVMYDKASKKETSNKKIVLTQAKSVLIAEDEDNNFLLLKEYVSSLNFNIIRALNGLEAVEICKSNKDIQLVLMDMKMPVLDGYEATKLIKNFRPDIIIIAQTAYAQVSDRNKALNSGCDDYISKPISGKDLSNLIGKYVVAD